MSDSISGEKLAEIFGQETVQKILDKGFVPVVRTDNEGTTISWSKPGEAYSYWPFAFVLITVMLFILLMVKGVPWA